ncbi:MAG: PH domain-containing protein, partial [Spirochaetales bacterium]|nr:PH domain-containing protein [Spirochaetales bacterium]
NLIFTLIGTLQVEEVFKITLFTLENITKFFKLIILLWTAWSALQILLRFNLAMFSHFILLQNEVIFIRNNLIHRESFRIPLSRIDQVYSQQNAIERFLDIGSISLKTRENSNPVIIPGVIAVSEKNRMLMDKIKIDLQKTK